MKEKVKKESTEIVAFGAPFSLSATLYQKYSVKLRKKKNIKTLTSFLNLIRMNWHEMIIR